LLYKDVMYYILSKVVPLGIGILFIPIVLNLLSIEEYGEYYTYYQYFLLINLFILSTTYYIQNNILENRQLIYRIQFFTIILSIIVAVLSNFFVYSFLGFENIILLIIITFTLILMGIYQNIMIILNVTGLSKLYFYGQFLFSFSKLIIVFFLMFAFYASSENVFLGILCSLIISVIFLEKKTQTFKRPFVYYDLKLFKEILRYGFFISFVFSVDLILNFINIIFANIFLNVRLLGIYTGWFSVFSMIISIATSIIYLPFISRVYKSKLTDPLKVSNDFKLLYKYTIGINLISVFFILIFGTWFFNLFITREYFEYYSQCLLLNIGFVINSIFKIEVLKLQVNNKINKNLFCTFFIAVILYIIVSYLFMMNDYLNILIWQSIIGSFIFYLILFIHNKSKN